LVEEEAISQDNPETAWSELGSYLDRHGLRSMPYQLHQAYCPSCFRRLFCAGGSKSDMRAPSIKTVPMVVVILLSILTVAGGAIADVALINPVEITFESGSPYYLPRTAVVPAGVPVRWVNQTGSHHSVRHDGCVAEATCAFQSIAVPPDSSFAIAPLAPGRYAYHCELHPIMRGTLVVVDADQPQGPTAALREEAP
jgi:plastocyanin